MVKVSIVKNLHQCINEVDLPVVIKEITDGKYKNEVEEIRGLYQEENDKEAEIKKKMLLGFTPSGNFNEIRSGDNIKSYTKLIVLDFDDIDKDQLEQAVDIVRACEYTYCTFISPSGQGFKVLCMVDSDKDFHEVAYNQINDYYEKLTGLKIDPSGKDTARLCFMSHDPQAYLNEQAKVFHVDTSVAVNSGKTRGKLVNNIPKIYAICKKMANKKSEYAEGNRNNYVYLLANICNRAGISESDALNYISKDFDLELNEIITSVSSAYKNTSQFGIGNFNAKVRKHNADESNEEEEIEESIKEDLPSLPPEVYYSLPNILNIGSEVLNSDREKDVFLIGALIVLSGMLRSVEGTYDQRTVYPNLNCFIIAPAASGKSSFSFAKALGKAYQDKLKKSNEVEFNRYEKEIRLYKQKIYSKTEINPDEIEPTKPPFKMLFFPANSSSASLFNLLKDNNEMGIFFETEADSMGNTLKQDWGGYSDLLRKSFHHETASYSRKVNNEMIEINKPRLSTGLTGTPSQVANLISSAEDGLFSRFIFYTFDSNPSWRDVSPNNDRPNLTKHFDNLSFEVLEIVEFLEKFPTEFDLKTEQWYNLNELFDRWLNEVNTFVSKDATSIVKRLGLIFFRVTMILSCLRKFYNGDTSTKIYCEQDDFDRSVIMSEVFLKHAIYMFKVLPKTEQSKSIVVKDFYDNLPVNFQRKEALTLGLMMNIKERTVDKYLKTMIENKLLVSDQSNYGHYIKT